MRFVAVVVLLMTGCAARQQPTEEWMERVRLRILALEAAQRGAAQRGASPVASTSDSEKIAVLEREVAALQVALSHIIAGAPDHGDTLAKIAARISVIVTGLDFQDAVKSNWWCGSFICFRSAALCRAAEERGLKPGDTAQDCIPRRNVFCRGFGYPLLGSKETGARKMSQVMTCHAFRDTCERAVQDAGGDCLGVE